MTGQGFFACVVMFAGSLLAVMALPEKAEPRDWEGLLKHHHCQHTAPHTWDCNDGVRRG